VVSWWNLTTMCDARHAAVTFLEQNAELLAADSLDPVVAAIKLYREETEVLDTALRDEGAFKLPVESWTPQVQRREQHILSQASELEEAAIAQIEKALAGISP